jgi:uncharacterized protein YbaP (TraB family)
VLWRIADADTEIHLFGTVHVLAPDLRWRSARVNAAFADADVVVLEADVEGPAAAEIARLVETHGRLPAGETLFTRLDPSTQARVRETARALSVPEAQLAPLRPWLAGLQLSLAYVEQQGASGAYGVETVLAAEARARGKRFRYLETAEVQIRALADLSPESEARFLSSSLDDIANEDGELAELDRAWAAGDIAALTHELDEMFARSGPEVTAAVLTGRNADWAPKVAALLDEPGRFFVAVGAAHLVGRASLIEDLRARGVAVEGP